MHDQESPSTFDARVLDLLLPWLRDWPVDPKAALERLCSENRELDGSLRQAYAALLDGAENPAEPGDARFALDRLEGLRLRAGALRIFRESGVHLGRGGWGDVVEVEDPDLQRRLAKKTLDPGHLPDGMSATRISAEMAGRFLGEAQILARLAGSGVPSVHDVGLTPEGCFYFLMDRVEGATLEAILLDRSERRATLELPELVDVLIKVCETIDKAHRNRIIHRDLKPSNIMVEPSGHTCVLDWGLAKRMDATPAAISADGSVAEPSELALAPTLDGLLIGSHPYLSPEQASGRNSEIDERTDVYCLGAILYEILTGRPPYPRPERRLSAAEIQAIMGASAPAPVRLAARAADAELASICQRAMAKAPSRRYADAGELAADLRNHREGRTVRAHSTAPLTRLRKWIGRNRLLSGLVSASVLLGLIALHVGLLRKQETASREWLRYVTDIWGADRALERRQDALARALLDGTWDVAPGWEWAFLKASSQMSKASWQNPPLGSGTDLVRSLDASIDGSVVAWGSESGSLNLLQPGADTVRRMPGLHQRAITCVRIAPDGSRLATCGEDGMLTIVALPEGTVTRSCPVGAVDEQLLVLGWDSQGRSLAIGTNEGRLLVVEPENGEILRERPRSLDPRRRGAITALVFLRGEGSIAFATQTGWLTLLGERNAEDLELERVPGMIRALAIDPGGERLFYSYGNVLAALDLCLVDQGSTILDKRFAAWAMAVSPDGHFLATGGEDGRVRLWSTGDLGCVREWTGHQRVVRAVCFAGLEAAYSGGHDGVVQRFRMRDDGNPLVVAELGAGIEEISVEPGSRSAAMIDARGRTWLWERAKSGAHELPGPWKGVASACALDTPGKRLAVGTRDGKCFLADIQRDADPSPAPFAEIEPEQGGIARVVFLPRSGRLLLGTSKGACFVFDPGGARARLFDSKPAGGLTALACSPDGDTVAAGFLDGTVRAWSLADAVEIWRVRREQRPGFPKPIPLSLCFDADGALLASGWQDNALLVCASGSGHALEEIQGSESDTEGLILGVSFVNRDSRLACGYGNGRLRMWKLDPRDLLLDRLEHASAVTGVHFDEEQGELLTCSRDGRLRLWSSSGRPVARRN